MTRRRGNTVSREARGPVGEVQTLICAFLEEGPQPVDELATLAGVSVVRVRAACAQLQAAALAREVKPGIWAEPSYQVPAPAPKAPNRGRVPKNGSGRPCQRCFVRWEPRGGLCRRCQRETGADTRTTFERERDRLAEHAAAVPPLPPPERTARGTRIIDGVEFEVVFSGRDSLLPPRGHASSLTGASHNFPIARVGRHAKAAQ